MQQEEYPIGGGLCRFLLYTENSYKSTKSEKHFNGEMAQSSDYKMYLIK
jgi:hypothetical protein